ncbi:MAG: hypothetical protein ACRC6N_02815, partial [Plesiomonas sp.]|uniref:hypothetical protein n=1 Tax=Plesiomonas sp. TaxID=2486279 RepID=UPI003F3DC6B0
MNKEQVEVTPMDIIIMKHKNAEKDIRKYMKKWKDQTKGESQWPEKGSFSEKLCRKMRYRIECWSELKKEKKENTEKKLQIVKWFEAEGQDRREKLNRIEKGQEVKGSAPSLQKHGELYKPPPYNEQYTLKPTGIYPMMSRGEEEEKDINMEIISGSIVGRITQGTAERQVMEQQGYPMEMGNRVEEEREWWQRNEQVQQILQQELNSTPNEQWKETPSRAQVQQDQRKVTYVESPLRTEGSQQHEDLIKGQRREREVRDPKVQIENLIQLHSEDEEGSVAVDDGHWLEVQGRVKITPEDGRQEREELKSVLQLYKAETEKGQETLKEMEEKVRLTTEKMQEMKIAGKELLQTTKEINQTQKQMAKQLRTEVRDGIALQQKAIDTSITVLEEIQELREQQQKEARSEEEREWKKA